MNFQEEKQVRHAQEILSNLLNRDEATLYAVRNSEDVSRTEWTDSEIEEAIALYVKPDVLDDDYLDILNKHCVSVNPDNATRNRSAVKATFYSVVNNKLLWARRNLTGTNYTHDNAGKVVDKWGLFKKGYIKFSDLVRHVMRYKDNLGIKNVYEAIDYVSSCIQKLYDINLANK